MAYFLFRPDPIGGVEFRPIRIDIHLGVVRMAQEEIYSDRDINNSEAVMVGAPREEVIARIQLALAREYERYGKLKEEDIPLADYDGRQQWKRIYSQIIRK